eukprot:jgi/Ulvmu1/10667/UM066_0051.1
MRDSSSDKTYHNMPDRRSRSRSPMPAHWTGVQEEDPTPRSKDWVNQLIDHLEMHGLARQDLEFATWSGLLDLERKTADKVASIVLNKDLRDVRSINNWIQSLLRKEADLGEGHQPGDIEDLSRRVKDAVFREVEARRIRPDDLSERCIAVLNDLPVNAAVEIIHEFAKCDHEKINNPAGYLMGMLRRYHEERDPHRSSGHGSTRGSGRGAGRGSRGGGNGNANGRSSGSGTAVTPREFTDRRSREREFADRDRDVVDRDREFRDRDRERVRR